MASAIRDPVMTGFKSNVRTGIPAQGRDDTEFMVVRRALHRR
jgi:hypothetical protein